MGLAIEFPSNHDLTQNETSYLMLERDYDDVRKSGSLNINAWVSKAARNAGSQKSCLLTIPIENADEVVDDENGGTIVSLSWDDVGWAGGGELYTKMKTLKVLIHGQVVDLSKAENA